jgi:hypothetical protein
VVLTPFLAPIRAPVQTRILAVPLSLILILALVPALLLVLRRPGGGLYERGRLFRPLEQAALQTATLMVLAETGPTLPAPVGDRGRHRPGLGGELLRIGRAALAAAATLALADGIAVLRALVGAWFLGAVAGITLARAKGCGGRILSPLFLSLAAARPLRSCLSARALPPR